MTAQVPLPNDPLYPAYIRFKDAAMRAKHDFEKENGYRPQYLLLPIDKYHVDCPREFQGMTVIWGEIEGIHCVGNIHDRGYEPPEHTESVIAMPGGVLRQ